jgi:predicted O-linked N-acetylglucosamine transferase (SPINDLY family)
MNIDKAIKLALEKFQTGNMQQVENICRNILKSEPNNFNALRLLGMTYSERKNYDLAIKSIKKALQVNSNIPESYHNLGTIFQDKGDFDEAIASYQKALQLNPNFYAAYYNLGTIFQANGDFDDAISSYLKAIKICPDFFNAYYNLGTVFRANGELDNAISSYLKALQINPNCSEIYNNLGSIYKDRGKIDEAEEAFRQAIKINPNFSDAFSNLLLTMQYNLSHDVQTIYAAHRNFARYYETPIKLSIAPHDNDRSLSRRLSIGYVSPDFRKHPVAYFIEGVLLNHDKDKFTVFCYTNSFVDDEVTKRIKEYADRWYNIVAASDDEVTELIRKDEIDILIDLAGHTAANRMLLFARKPAPIQISWIGYPFTTGLSGMNYKIVDCYTDPPGMTDHLYTEKLIRMRESFLCYLPDKESPEISPLPSLSKGHITFGSFNNFAKLSAEIIALWVMILRDMPDAHLIIKAESLSDSMTRHYAMNMFTNQGIPEERIELVAPKLSTIEHLNTYNRVDIGLDTFPYNGTTTTCEALWMGVPVITLAGNSHCSRVGTSLLSNAGLPELVAKTSDEYRAIAISLARNLKKLQSLRLNLRDMMKHSPLCNANKFTEKLEIVYHRMWKKYCNQYEQTNEKP